MIKRSAFYLVCGLILLMAQSQIAGEDAQNFYVPPSGKESAPKASAAALPEEDIFAQLVTLRFKDAELQNVIRMVADQTGLNIIMAKEQVKGTITLDLEDVPLGAALDAILKTHGLAFVREPGGIVRIVPRSEIRATTIELKTVHVPINWVLATTLAETLRPFISKAEGAQIQADSESNALVITDTPPSVDTLLALVEKLDVPEKQVMIEMRLVDISKEVLHMIGSNWSISQTMNTGIAFANLDHFKSMNDINVPGGGRWTWGHGFSILGEDFDFDALLEAYETRGLVSVLANPKVITLNNIKAKIEITEDIPYENTVIGQGGTTTIEVEFKKAGITLEVLPKITNNGYIRMNLKPTQEIFRRREYNVPLIDKRAAETNVIVRDEETVVLGGLRQDNFSDGTNGTPWFMDIPVLGWLFKNNTKEKKQLEMVMFVTPHIIKEPALTELEKIEYEHIDYGWKLPEAFFTQEMD
ncbi:secretin and TonB N-terminal domain-containing protein [Candidatus Sumerlaeota bacterium]|nr:secretin and TonB N-terminal domain-containing protein [Candidatus Sumerlaeota bacterium]